VDTIERSYIALEKSCVAAVTEVATKNKAGLDEQAECLGRLNE
jgi:predicted transcriptional regulator